MRQNPEKYFAQQHTSQATEHVTIVSAARQKNSEETRNSNERFYNGLALYSGGTIALSVTFMGYLKSAGKPPAHPRWLVTSWVCLLVCATCSLFWTFVYGYYTFYFHEWQTANASKNKSEVEATEYPALIFGAYDVQTRAPISQKEVDDAQASYLAVARKHEGRAAKAKRYETFYNHLWEWLGRIARTCFLVGLGFLLAFAIKNL